MEVPQYYYTSSLISAEHVDEIQDGRQVYEKVKYLPQNYH